MSSSLRIRRTLRAISALHHSFSATSAPSYSVPMHRAVSSIPQSPNPLLQSRAFRSSSISLLSARSPPTNIPDEIGPDTILFEGCDYNHWLFVMDFPKDNKPSPEQMIEVYEQTCAKGLNISLEEAKKKIYACSTTTYTGFQAVMTEEESKKFEGLPGVIFVLPDSYIDPVNKEYGGDKYINGTIIPRPPPIQYGRNQGRRDRNRNPGQYNRQENPMSSPQGNLSYNNWGSVRGDGRNYGASQNYTPQQNYGQASQNNPPEQNYGQASQNYPPKQNYGQASQNYPPQQNYGQASQNYPPQQNYGQASPNYPPQQNYGQASQNYPPQQNYGQASQNYPPQQNYGSTSQQRHGPASPQYAPQRSFGPPGQGERRNFVPTHGADGTSQVQRDAFVPSYKKEFEEAGSPQNAPQQNLGSPGQGERRNPAPIDGARKETFTPSYVKDFTPSYMEDFKPSYMEEFEHAGQGNYFTKEQAGSQQRYPPPGQGKFTVDNRNDDHAQNGNYGQGVGFQGQGSHSEYRDGQRFTQGGQSNEQGVQRSYGPLGLTGTEQGRY